MALNLGSPLSLEVQSVAPAAKPKGALLLRCRDPALLTTQARDGDGAAAVVD